MAERGRPRAFDRDLALRRAMEVFWSKGYDNTSMTDLTSVMGINSPSLYAAFGSKEALFREAVQLYGKAESPEIWQAISEAPTAREAVAGFLHTTAEAFTQPGKPAGCLIVLGALHASGSNEDVCRTLRELRSENAAELRARFDGDIAAGKLPPGFDSARAAAFYITVQQGMSIQARDGASREMLHAIADGALAAWDGLAGVRRV